LNLRVALSFFARYNHHHHPTTSIIHPTMSDFAINPAETSAYNKGYAEGYTEGYRRALLAVNASVGELMVQSAISPPAPAQLPNRTQPAGNPRVAPPIPRLTKPVNPRAATVPDSEDSDSDIPFAGPSAAKSPKAQQVQSIPRGPSSKRPRIDGGTPESSGALDQPHDCSQLTSAERANIKAQAQRRGLKRAALKGAYFKGEVSLAGHVAVTIYRPGGPCARCKEKNLICIVPDPAAAGKNFFNSVSCAECQGYGTGCKDAT
jgi:hypothetical protein